MALYKYHPHGWKKHDEEVGRRTVAELEKNGIVPNPNSSIYKKTFNRLSAVYRSEVSAERKAKEKLEAEWAAQHKDDTDEQFLAYLREAVTTPEQLRSSKGITGGRIILKHFGGWQKALRLAGLLPPEEQAQSPPQEQ